jgi:hypothetical protein
MIKFARGNGGFEELVAFRVAARLDPRTDPALR